MTKLSVNINKIATLRNARGGGVPDVIQVARDCERFGADGITVHPRPDERHIRYQDVLELKKVVGTEFNVEGYPSEEFMKLVLTTLPHQVTLVPDPPGVITSNAGWDTITHETFLKNIVSKLKNAGIIKGNIEGNAICYCIDEKVIGKLKSVFSGYEMKIEKKRRCC